MSEAVNIFARHNPRLAAGISFALLGILPGLLLHKLSQIDALDSIWLIHIAPPLASAIAGALNGWKIITATSRGESARRGFMTSLLAYTIFTILFFATIAGYILFDELQPRETLAANLFEALWWSFAFMFTYGMLIVGWWSFLLGAWAGCGLYRMANEIEPASDNTAK